MPSDKVCLNSTSYSETRFCYVSADSKFFSSHNAVCAQIFAISVLIVSCLLFNSLMLYAVYKTSSHRSSVSSILLTNLAIVNVLVGILVLPFWISSTAHLGWILPYKLCELTAFVTMTLMQCSIFFLSGIAVDRYCSIRYPLRYPIIATNTRVGLVVSMIWVLCLLVASFPLYGWGRYRFQPQTIPICNPVYHEHVSYTIFLILFGMALPFTLMLVSYIKIVQIARDHIRRIDQQLSQALLGINNRKCNRNSVDMSTKARWERSNVKSTFARNLKTVRRVCIAVVVFFLCWGPYIILNFWFVNHDTEPVPYSADLVTTLMAFANSTVNPVIFILLNKDYRRVVRRLTVYFVRCCRENAVTNLNDNSDNVSYIDDRTNVNFNIKSNANRKNSVCHNGSCSRISVVSKSGEATVMFKKNSEHEPRSITVQPVWNTGKFEETAHVEHSHGKHTISQTKLSNSLDKTSGHEWCNRRKKRKVASIPTEPSILELHTADGPTEMDRLPASLAKNKKRKVCFV